MSSTGYQHDEVEALIAAAALDGLDEPDRRRLAEIMAEHGDACPECRRLTVEYAETAAHLAASLDPRPLPSGAEERLVAAMRRSRPEGAGTIDLTERRRERDRPSIRPRPAWARRGVAGIAAAAVIAAAAALVGYGIGVNRSNESRQLAAEQLIEFVTHPDTRVVSFPPRGDQRLAVALSSGQREAFVLASNLAPPPADRVYQLWAAPDESFDVQPAGTFVPEDGSVITPTRLPQPVRALAVSIEPEGGSEQPTTEPIFVTEL